MIFKERLLLSNCDSVRVRDAEGIKARIIFGLLFSDGVVLSPNILIDNYDIESVLKSPNIEKYLKEEGSGKLALRGFNINASSDSPLMEYFEMLPDSFKFSSFPNGPIKSELTKQQAQTIISRLSAMDEMLISTSSTIDKIELSTNSLSNEILKRIDRNERDFRQSYFSRDSDEFYRFRESAETISSRSEWYEYCDSFFINESMDKREEFRIEIVDPSYNYLFCNKGEGLIIDDIKGANLLSNELLDSTLSIATFKNEHESVAVGINLMTNLVELVTTTDPVSFLTGKAYDFLEGSIEDKLKDKGIDFMGRRNWFGLYPLMTKKMGIEIK